MYITQAELVRELSSNIDKFSWFLGAGSSVSANLPTANDIIWDLKKRYYCSEENQDIGKHDIQILPIKKKIQSYMDSKDFPAQYDSEEYSFYFELVFGDDREAQRKYLAEILAFEKTALSVGHRALGALMSLKKTKLVYTTNFDKVIENAYSYVYGQSLGSYHLEGAESCIAALNNDEFPIYAKIHGDFQYQKLFNLSEDLITADKKIRECFVASSSRFGTVVTGYSGRDKCVMDMFEQALSVNNAFPHGIYWTVRKGSSNKRVNSLISLAETKGIKAKIVEIDSFDSLLSQVWRNISNRDKDIDAKVQRLDDSLVDIPLPTPNSNGEIMSGKA